MILQIPEKFYLNLPEKSNSILNLVKGTLKLITWNREGGWSVKSPLLVGNKMIKNSFT